MKCPKCGFNSFEYYDSCKKCSSDLIAYKQTYGITSVVLPLEAKEKMAAEFRSAERVTDQISDTTEKHDDIFSFDLPEDSSRTSAQRNDDPFNFDEPSPGTKQPGLSESDDDIFADLLESTSQAEGSPFAAAKGGVAPAPVATKAADASSGPGEFDLESFSWDDTPETTAATGSKETADDFDSLFGDTKEGTPKK